MSVLSLKRSQPARSSEREALATALNALVGVARTMAVANNTVARARDLRDQTAARDTAAAEAAVVARAGHADAMLRSARSGAAVAVGSGYRDLRHAAADAADDLEAAKSALETAEVEYASAEYEALAAKKRISAAVDAVLLAELPGEITRVRAAIEDLVRVIEPLDFLRRLECAPPDLRGTGQALVENIRILIRSVASRHVEYPPKDRWDAARQALMDNPEAPLPTSVEA